MSHDDDTADTIADLPDALIAELKRADKRPAMIMSRVDRAMSEQARAHFRQRPAKSRLPQPVWYAIAASVLFAMFLYVGNEPDIAVTDELFTDVDGSGQIDIADVMALARRGGKQVSQEQLDRFALQLVSLTNNAGKGGEKT